MTRKKLTALVLVSLFACAGAGPGDTPEATFDAMKTAAAKKDYAGMVTCMSGDMQDVALGSIVMMAQFPGLVPGVEADKMKGAQAILDKHGVKPFDLTKLATAPSDATSLMKSLVGDVKDRPAALAELMMYMEKNVGATQNQFDSVSVAASTISDVKIDGDKATAKIKSTKDGKETEDSELFRKVNGKWYADLDLSKLGTPK